MMTAARYALYCACHALEKSDEGGGGSCEGGLQAGRGGVAVLRLDARPLSSACHTVHAMCVPSHRHLRRYMLQLGTDPAMVER